MFEYNFELRRKRHSDPSIGGGIIQCQSMYNTPPVEGKSATILVPYAWVVDGTIKDLREDAA
ncbi:hypothetical protein PP754_gp057 [Pectobacterium phage Possum]|uniref:Uncharacterized protein n=1 Tax=Pectobacterium phage Possum TaxID=2686301 RepID=A0A7T0Q159_9CAUD|nr:hypothetical protein PP754_gp057 [Pectobacterium phage Possum]QPL10898.1 hypothetical protein Possum_00057 [Pectobacterium phage Possum]QPL11000.1 hypothetical protein Horatius_00057 [Pectobacterium phage Horatius]